MLHKLKQRNDGFTIIEVLIVLAIAGLMMMVVFLAVPALQRNARNSQRESDTSRVAAAVQEIVNNNNGNTAGVTTANLQSSTGAMSFYGATDVLITPTAAAATAANVAASTANQDRVYVYPGAVCGAVAATTGFSAGLGATSTGANSRNFAVIYTKEGGGNRIPACTPV